MAEGMTIKQIAETAGVSRDAVEKSIKKLFPGLSQQGKVTLLDQAQTIKVMSDIPKRNIVELPTGAEALPTGAEVTPDTRIDRLELLVERLITGIPSIINQTVRAVARISPPAHAQGQLALPAASNGSYFTIKGYAARLGNSVRVADAVRLGREASKISREKNYAIRQVEDEAWGRVNSYHIDVLKEVFTI